MQNPRSPWSSQGVHESTSLLREIIQTSDEFESYMGRQLSVNPTDLQAMENLIMAGPMSPTQIARKLNVSTAAATAVIDRLTALGHVSRAPHPSDRRGVLVVPTDTSVARAMDGLLPMIIGIDRVIHDFDADQQQTIVDYLSRVVDVYKSSMSEPESE